MTCAAIAIASALLLPCGGQALAADTIDRLTPGEMLLGILSYSRWPGAPRPLTLCVVGARDAEAADLGRLHERVVPGRLMPVRLLAGPGGEVAVPAECDAVYATGTAAADLSLAPFTGRPVLTVGDGSGFCSRGGMFCMVPRGTALRLEVNLDVVARSGLKVHPQVLKLGLPRQEAPS
ncbi:MAG: hypothetical protein RL456_787 [Pseudomonadota bacterium]|jgi:hypothetical protein